MGPHVYTVKCSYELRVLLLLFTRIVFYAVIKWYLREVFSCGVYRSAGSGQLVVVWIGSVFLCVVT